MCYLSTQTRGIYGSNGEISTLQFPLHLNQWVHRDRVAYFIYYIFCRWNWTFHYWKTSVMILISVSSWPKRNQLSFFQVRLESFIMYLVVHIFLFWFPWGFYFHLSKQNLLLLHLLRSLIWYNWTCFLMCNVSQIRNFTRLSEIAICWRCYYNSECNSLFGWRNLT